MTDLGRGPGRLRPYLSPGVAALVLAAVAAVAVAVVHATVFEHLSVNHDEGVYLQQAAMLLDGQVVMQAGDLAGAVRPWFFVREGGTLYPKYTPVTAAVFAAAKLLAGSYAAALPAIAFAIVLLTVHLTAAAFDRRTGLVAGGLLAASPLFIVNAATFLSYAPATALNLLFALAYVLAIRRGSLRWAGVAGVAVGLAFFARPYTAVLFAAPFVGHATLATIGACRSSDRSALVTVGRRNATNGTLGLAFVALALAYNWRLTGSPLLFPYEAFAPQDGVGFGHREMLGHGLEYTVAVGIRANALVLWVFLTEWFVAPPFGALLAIGGAAAFLARAWNGWGARQLATPLLSVASRVPADELSDDAIRTLLLGVAATVVAGNVAFWGNMNILGNPSVRGDGLIAALGPFYHFDLLLPLSAFAAHGALLGWDRLRAGVVARTDRCDAIRIDRLVAARFDRSYVVVVLAALLVVAPLLAANAAAVREPLEHNAGHQERLDRVYEPFDERSFDRALVFVPTPYGEWLNHPFQRLRNDPSLDGRVLYAMDRGPGRDFEVIDAASDRRPYRFTYRGEWSEDPDARVTQKLERLRVVEGDRVRVSTTLGVPDGARLSSVRLEADGNVAAYRPAPGPSDEYSVDWLIAADRASVLSGVISRTSSDGGNVTLDGASEVSLAVTVVQPGGATMTYRQDLTVEPTSEGVRVVWPPETRVCRLTPDCGREGTYLPDDPAEHVDGVAIEANVTTPRPGR